MRGVQGNEVVKKLGLDKLAKKYKALKETYEALEEEIRDKAGRSGYGYSSSSDIERGEINGSKIKKEVEKRLSNKIDLDAEMKRLESLRDQLLEELWLAGQPADVKEILSKMV